MKSKKQNENYLERIPIRREDISFKKDENGLVTLEIENKGVFNRIAQRLFKKPEISYIHLDEMGSFIWPIIDGKRSIYDLSFDVDKHFGEKAHPLYERIAQYFRILDSYGFVVWKR